MALETVPAKTIVTRNKSTAWFGCEYTMNLYRGCCHGCLYCDSRSDCYHIDDFDTVRLKANALAIVRNDLARRVKTGVVATGAMSDPYNPYEKAEIMTRNALQLLHAYGFGVAIATKSDLLLRDTDILTDIASQAPVLCKITVTALDDSLAEKLEPRAPSSSRRFAALETLAREDLFSGILLMPVLPYLEDSEENILGIVRRAAACGARFVYPAFGVTMRAGQREHFLRGLDAAFPGRELAQKYRQRYGSRYFCSSPRAEKLWYVFRECCERNNILYEMRDIIRAYKQGYEIDQLSFY